MTKNPRLRGFNLRVNALVTDLRNGKDCVHTPDVEVAQAVARKVNGNYEKLGGVNWFKVTLKHGAAANND